jgi:hypothetical protein
MHPRSQEAAFGCELLIVKYIGNLCYTHIGKVMEQFFWSNWAQTLQRLKLTGIFLPLLEGAGPIRVILAQLMLAGIPFASSSSKTQWMAAAEMLEDGEESRHFAEYLREQTL